MDATTRRSLGLLSYWRNADLGPIASKTSDRLLRRNKRADCLRDLEAPPGFELGMEVLQGHPRCFFPDRRTAESAEEITTAQSDT